MQSWDLMGSLVHAHAGGGLYSGSFMKGPSIQWLTWKEVTAATSLVGHTQLGLSYCVRSQNRNCFVFSFVLSEKFDIVWMTLHFS